MMADLRQPVEPDELRALHARFGVAPHRHLQMLVDTPFLDGEHQLLTSARRRAEVCYVMHRGDPADGVLLHRKVFYPDRAYRLPTGGIHEGEGVLETLAREIEEETSFQIDLSLLPPGSRGEKLSAPSIGRPEAVRPSGADRIAVTVQAFLGTLSYQMVHRSQDRIHTFATYHFLVAAPAGATPTSLDPSEQVAGWQWRSLREMNEVAEWLDRIGEIAPAWRDWGHFRAHSHRFVAEALPP